MTEREKRYTQPPWNHTMRNANEIMTTFHGVQIGRVYIDVTTENERADSRLIAAAPDLLEALEAIMKDDGTMMRPSCIEKARDAIAKAYGDTP